MLMESYHTGRTKPQAKVDMFNLYMLLINGKALAGILKSPITTQVKHQLIIMA
jgi:hypothetical protein